MEMPVKTPSHIQHQHGCIHDHHRHNQSFLRRFEICLLYILMKDDQQEQERIEIQNCNVNQVHLPHLFSMAIM